MGLFKKKIVKKPRKNNKVPNTSNNVSTRSKHRIKSFLPSKPLEYILLAIILIAGFGTLFYYRFPVSRTEVASSDLTFTVDYVDDATIELGQQNTRNKGENGTKETTYHVKRTLAGKELSRTIASEKTIKSPVHETIAKGTKKFQFMWCSNGSYRYYSNDEFKNPFSGFTHQSPDACAQNNQGHMTGLADTAPLQPTNVYPTTTIYQRPSPTSTHCYDTGIYSSSFSCYSY